jgi:hypothetical protein
MSKLRLSVVFLAAAVLFSACGDGSEEESTTSSECPVVEGDKHLAEDDSQPDGLPVMLHVVGRECLVVGENKLHLYAIGGGDEEMHAHSVRPLSMAKVDDLTVTDVKPTMPSMGHGTATAPKLGDGGAFTVDFQMPGEWKIEIEFSTPETTVSQQAVFLVTVK